MSDKTVLVNCRIHNVNYKKMEFASKNASASMIIIANCYYCYKWILINVLWVVHNILLTVIYY